MTMGILLTLLNYMVSMVKVVNVTCILISFKKTLKKFKYRCLLKKDKKIGKHNCHL